MGESPVPWMLIILKSRIIYVYKYSNIAEPSAKPKYLLIIDSERVLWRKGEKVF